MNEPNVYTNDDKCIVIEWPDIYRYTLSIRETALVTETDQAKRIARAVCQRVFNPSYEKVAVSLMKVAVDIVNLHPTSNTRKPPVIEMAPVRASIQPVMRDIGSCQPISAEHITKDWESPSRVTPKVAHILRTSPYRHAEHVNAAAQCGHGISEDTLFHGRCVLPEGYMLAQLDEGDDDEAYDFPTGIDSRRKIVGIFTDGIIPTDVFIKEKTSNE